MSVYVLYNEGFDTAHIGDDYIYDPLNCSVVDCGRPPSVENGYVSIPNGTTFGDTVLYGCDSGYFQPGSVTNTRMCQADGTWSGVVPPCLSKYAFTEKISLKQIP